MSELFFSMLKRFGIDFLLKIRFYIEEELFLKAYLLRLIAYCGFHASHRQILLRRHKNNHETSVPAMPRIENLTQLTDDAALQYVRAVHLCLITAGMLGLAFIINLFEGNGTLLVTLGITLTLTLGFFCVLRVTRKGTVSLIGVSILLMGLGGFLLCWRCAPDGSSLFWFLLLPPMLLFCVGLKQGTILFACFFVFLLLIMLTPLSFFLAYDFPDSLRFRFLGALFGTFIFSWLAEYTRTQTRNALIQAVKMLHHSALTDPLTTLGNRRDFQNYFRVNHAQLQRSNRMFSIAMVDIDFFKKINDTFGHAVGDRVLCHVSSVLLGFLRASDRVFRWGGEEFIILMPATTAAEARIIMERLRHEVEITPYMAEEGKLIPVTISIGMYSGTLSATIDTHIAAADQNLYLAKKNGRNQVYG